MDAPLPGASGKPASVKRGCIGTMISGGCGCTAFLVGAALAMALAAPQLLSGVAADGMERHLEGRIAGDVEVYDLQLHWSEFQRARRVTVHTLPGEGGGQGDSVAEFTLRFPSLLDLLTKPNAEWVFKFTNARFTARVDSDGTSDLGRCLGLEAADGRTEIVALLGLLGEVAHSIDAGDSYEYEGRSVRTLMNHSSVQFIDMDSGTDRVEATLSNFSFTATKSRVGYQVELNDALIQHSLDQEARVSLKLNFGGRAREAGETGAQSAAWSKPVLLRSGELRAEPIPLRTLRLMGLAPRKGMGVRETGNRRLNAGFGSSNDAYRPMGGALFDGLAAFLEDGASIEATYGEKRDEAQGLSSAPAPAPAAGAGNPQLTVHAASEFGVIDISAAHDGEWLVGSRNASGESSLRAEFSLGKNKLELLFRALALPEGVEVDSPNGDAKWYLASDSFKIPLRTEDLSVASFFGNEWAGSTGAPSVDASAPRRAANAGWRRSIAAAMRRSGGVFKLSSRPSSAAKLALMPSDEELQEDGDRLDWTHRLTQISLFGDLGASVKSAWLVEQSASSELALLNLTIPGAPLTQNDSLVPRLDVTLPAMPISLIKGAVELPEDLALLLPNRLDSLSLKGVPVPQLLAGTGSSRRPSQASIEVVAAINSSELVEGTFQGGVLRVPRATLVAPLSAQLCEDIIMGYMPWFESIEPSDGGSLEMELRDFSFSLAAGELEQSGQMTLRPDPLRVTLLPEIATKLTISDAERASQDEDQAEGIRWFPSPTLLTLTGLGVDYQRIELPLSDDYVATLEGNFNRGSGRFTLSGLVESQFIRGPGGSEALWEVAIIGRASDGAPPARVTFNPGTIDPTAFTDFMKELGDKAK